METIRKTIYDIDLSKQLQRIFSGVLLAKNDKQANRMGVNVYQDGQAVSLSGYTVKGYFIRSGVETLILTGAIDGNTAYVDLDAKCYHKDGSFSLSVVLCRDGREQTLVIFDGRIACTCTDTVVENENTLSLADIAQQEWVTNVLNAADTAMEQAGKAEAAAAEAQNILEEAAAKAQAIVDSIPPDYTEAVKKLDEKAPAIFVDATGYLVHITDGAAMPVKSLITHIEPVQEGEGEKSPANPWVISGRNKVSLTGAGQNLIPMFTTNTTISSASGYNSPTVHIDNVLPHDVPLTIRLFFTDGTELDTSGTVFILTDADNKTIKQSGYAGLKITLTEAEAKKITAYRVYFNATGAAELLGKTIANVQLTNGDTKESVTYQGQTLTADLPETVYGGTLDWGTGVLTVDRVAVNIKGTFVSGYGVASTGINYVNLLVSKLIYKPLSEANNIACCNIYPIQIDAAGPPVHPAIRATTHNWLMYDNRFTDEETAKALLDAETPQIVYTIATPYTIQLTPQQLETPKGTNNVWSDAGQTEVTYAADTKMYIDNLVTALVNGQKEE